MYDGIIEYQVELGSQLDCHCGSDLENVVIKTLLSLRYQIVNGLLTDVSYRWSDVVRPAGSLSPAGSVRLNVVVRYVLVIWYVLMVRYVLVIRYILVVRYDLVVQYVLVVQYLLVASYVVARLVSRRESFRPTHTNTPQVEDDCLVEASRRQ